MSGMCEALALAEGVVSMDWFVRLSPTECRTRTDSECTHLLGVTSVWRGGRCLVSQRGFHCPIDTHADNGACVTLWKDTPRSAEDCAALLTVPVTFSNGSCAEVPYTAATACPRQFWLDGFSQLCLAACVQSRDMVALGALPQCRQMTDEECTAQLATSAHWWGVCTAGTSAPMTNATAAPGPLGSGALQPLAVSPLLIVAAVLFLLMVVSIACWAACVKRGRSRICGMSVFAVLATAILLCACFQATQHSGAAAALYLSFIFTAWVMLVCAAGMLCFSSKDTDGHDSDSDTESERQRHRRQARKTHRAAEGPPDRHSVPQGGLYDPEAPAQLYGVPPQRQAKPHRHPMPPRR